MLSNPILKDIRNFFSYIFVWLIITAAYILILIYGEKISLEIAFADGLMFNILLAGFGLSYWYSAKYISFESSSMLKILISHMIGGVISVSLWLALGFFITNFLTSSTEEYSTFFINNFGWRFLVGLLFYFLIIAFYYLIIYYTNFQDKSLREKELKNIKLYLEIEKIRFEDKFDFNEEVAPESRDMLVPNMILQPLFENAIKHAVYESLEKVTLKFKSLVQNDFLNISLENNFDSTSENKSGSGIGLKNISERLKLIYGLNNLINVEKTEGIFRVNLYIPLSK